MSLSNNGKIKTRTKEDLLELDLALRSICEPSKKTIERESLFARSRLTTWALIEHVWVQFRLDNLERDKRIARDPPN